MLTIFADFCFFVLLFRFFFRILYIFAEPDTRCDLEAKRKKHDPLTVLIRDFCPHICGDCKKSRASFVNGGVGKAVVIGVVGLLSVALGVVAQKRGMLPQFGSKNNNKQLDDIEGCEMVGGGGSSSTFKDDDEPDDY